MKLVLNLKRIFIKSKLKKSERLFLSNLNLMEIEFEFGISKSNLNLGVKFHTWFFSSQSSCQLILEAQNQFFWLEPI